MRVHSISSLAVGALVALAGSAAPVMGDITTVAASPLSGFAIFSGGGVNFNSQGTGETAIGGHTTVTGDIGSNQDLRVVGGQTGSVTTQFNGSVYVGGYLDVGQPLTIGSPTLRASVVVNGVNVPAPPPGTIEAEIRGTIYGDLYTTGDVRLGNVSSVRQVGGLGGNVRYTGNYTAVSGAVVEGTALQVGSTTSFTTISMPAAMASWVGGANQTVPSGSGSSLTVAPGTHGALATSAQNQTVNLVSGTYRFDSITAQGDFTLRIDLTSGLPISILALGDMTFGQSATLMVLGAGTGGNYVPISAAQSLASLIYFETRSRFVMGGATSADPTIWGGTVYASLREDGGSQGEVDIGQHNNWYGAIYAFDSIDIADHGTFTYVPLPTPGAGVLLALGGAVVGRRRRA